MKIQKFQNSGQIKQGTKRVGSKANNYRSEQKSLLGEREYKPSYEQSLAEKFINNISDKLHITSPPTFEDGYGRTLNAEVPLKESAQGQELKRMGNTAKNAGLTALTAYTLGSLTPVNGTPVLKSLLTKTFWKNPINWVPKVIIENPLETAGGIVLGGAGAGTGHVVGKQIDKGLESKGYSLEVPAEDILSTTGGLVGGVAGGMYGNAVTKRAIETVMHGSGGNADMAENALSFIRFEPKTKIGKKLTPNILQKRVEDGSNFANVPKKLKKDVFKYILFNKQNRTGTANTIAFAKDDNFGTFPYARTVGAQPYFAQYYDGTHGVSFSGMPAEGGDLVATSLYGKPLSILKEGESHFFDNYIREKYPKVARKIKTYTSPDESGLIPAGEINIEPIGQADIVFPGIARIDAGGHNHLLATTADGQPIHKFTDIWKFNADDYLKRYFANSNEKPSWITEFGLRVVDNHTTPVITDTGWMLDASRMAPKPLNKPSSLYAYANTNSVVKPAVKKSFFKKIDGKFQLDPAMVHPEYYNMINTYSTPEKLEALKKAVLSNSNLSAESASELIHAINTKKKWINNGWLK